MISVIGLGFVGLTTALGLAEYKYEVYGIEKNCEKKTLISNKTLPFYEPGLDQALEGLLDKNFFVCDDFSIVEKSQYIFVCVGTPCGENGEADLTDIFMAINNCLENLNGNRPVFVIKSTVPPSTTFGKIKKYIESQGFVVGKDLYLSNNPEFLREGYSWHDFMNPGRIVVGVEDEYTAEKMIQLYKPISAPIHVVTGNTAEFIKYLSNSLLATMISFSNEMAEVAEGIGGIQTAEAFKILHEDERWNNCNMTSYVYPGCGYGGYCLPKDTAALSNIAKSNGVETKILDQVINLNNDMAASIAKRISKQVSKRKTIGILGLSFKPGSDDVRETSAYKIIKELISLGYSDLKAYDPMANRNFEKTYQLKDCISYSKSLEDIYIQADVLVILTGWQEFKKIKKENFKNKLILDYRYML